MLLPLAIRYCLASLKTGNTRNAQDILQAVRLSPALARDVHKLREALALLREEDDSQGRLKLRESDDDLDGSWRLAAK